MRKYFINDVPFHKTFSNFGLFMINGIMTVLGVSVLWLLFVLTGSTYNVPIGLVLMFLTMYTADTIDYIKRVNHAERLQ